MLTANRYQYLYKLIENNKLAIKKALSKSPYDQSHLLRALNWEFKNIDGRYNFRRLLGLVNTDEPIQSVFFETDNLLGAINAKRSELKRRINSKQNINNQELDNLFNLSDLIKDYPGIVKAYQLMAKTGNLSDYDKSDKIERSSKFKHALHKVQWNIIVKILVRMGTNIL
ncbi:MAG: hypothetical protein BRC46_14510 [Cyanobacteria bacterium QS_6_48_18]|nr:MAG: hypothetical protein BRC45_16370 [Cyanobacteria bacterium QS_5_48_63]PSO83759.1 MAG: hypothetical protein BRC43_17640 [Cyanobacteria bacterium QS_3_48_167]PSO90058.1 MAG: hypothetical protein BRC46_14510 [Cyanobacteria bacterium QS_6_48_18]